MVERVVDDVFECGFVLLLRFDQLRPEAPAEDVVAAAVAFVEGARVGAVQVAHAVGEVRARRLDDQVVVVPQQAADVGPPVVAALHAPQDVHEDDAVPVVQHDRSLVVAARRDVVVRAGGEVAMWATHRVRP
jgi:phosphohistidine swiveling domain-containing protein